VDGSARYAADLVSREELLEKRLIFVTGKGGVGKSTVAIALGLLAARHGRRTIVAEIAEQDRVARAFDHDAPGFHETELAERLFTISIDPAHAMAEYLRLQLKVGPVADVLLSSRMFTMFAAATPGMRELLTIGKVWELAQLERRTRRAARYDLVIVDGPASGHGVGILRTPKTFADLARVGPIAHQGRTIHATITDDRRTAVLAVALPEEMPVTETLELRRALDRDLGIALAGVVVNGVLPRRFSAADARAITAAGGNAGTPAARAALRAALTQHARSTHQQAQVRRLARGIDDRPVTLPFLYERDMDRPQLDTLSRKLEAAL
jgi:anion-transporting  ArsA/GET3 family ATPase